MSNLFLETVEVTNLADANKLIKERTNGFLKLFNSSPACMSMTTLDREYVKINKKFTEKFGYSEEEVVGKKSVDIGMLDITEMKRVSELLKETGSFENEVILCRTKTGKPVYTISSIEKIEFDGQTYLLSTFLDISKIKEQQELIEEQHKNIVDSINYARLIQNCVLPHQKQMEEILPDSFVLSKPKDILSGDFHWIKKMGNKIFISACDCTGHGVPGALISIVGIKLLSKFISEYRFFNPAQILNQLNREFTVANKHNFNAIDEIRDGMDIALCAVNPINMTMEYAGAYNPIYVVRKGVLTQLETDKIPVNLFSNYHGKVFTNHEINIEKGDLFYLFSDGYADQFGGPKGKKFNSKKFQELILSVHHLPMEEQRKLFDKTIVDWRNHNGDEQTDDILVVGFRV